MKKSLLLIAMSTAMLSSPFVLAQATNAPAQTPNTATQNRPAGSNSAVTPANRAAPSSPATGNSNTSNTNDQHSIADAAMTDDLDEMEGKMEKMQEQMAKISATKDDAERQKLIEAHMVTMKDNMASMKDMHARMQGMHSSSNMPPKAPAIRNPAATSTPTAQRN